jgi:hypothetical protein
MVEGGELSAAVSLGAAEASWLSSAPAWGAAEKNSFAIRASMVGSRGAEAGSPGVPGITGSAVPADLPGSLVFMVLSDLDVIERGNRIIGKHGS